MAKTKATNSQAKAQAEAPNTLGTCKIVGGKLIITMPTVWDGESYSNKGADGVLPDCERTKRVGMISQRIELDNGEILNLSCNVTQSADVKVSQKQRDAQHIAQLERKLERFEAKEAMI